MSATGGFTCIVWDRITSSVTFVLTNIDRNGTYWRCYTYHACFIAKSSYLTLLEPVATLSYSTSVCWSYLHGYSYLPCWAARDKSNNRQKTHQRLTSNLPDSGVAELAFLKLACSCSVRSCKKVISHGDCARVVQDFIVSCCLIGALSISWCVLLDLGEFRRCPLAVVQPT